MPTAPAPLPAALATASGPRLAAADPFADLNAEQRDAVMHGDSPLLVIAGAGTGKTMTLAARVARLVLDGADPNRLLLLTFSRRAAAEMAHRAGLRLHRALGWGSTHPPPRLPWAGTFHGIGARLLRELAPRIGLHADFTIVDRPDAEDLMGLARQELGLGDTRDRFPQKATCLAIYSRAVNTGRPLREVLAADFPWCASWEAELQRLFGAYAEAKHQQHTLDYDDLLLAWAAALEEPAVARAVSERFDHILVDEYQDTNALQAQLLRALRPDGRGLTVVGDDAQSIYGFRAAEVRNILGFPQQFAPPARVVTLTRNYRSTAPILEASNGVIALAAERHAKSLWSEEPGGTRPQLVTVDDEAAQARWVADRVLAHRETGLALKRQAVLFRAAHHSAALELELTRRNIPFLKFGGLKFLEAAHVKDVLALLRWAENPRARIAGFRIAQQVPGVGPASARRLLDAMAEAEDPAAALAAFNPPPAARAEWQAFAATYAALREPAADWPADLDTALAWYRPQLRRLHDDAPVREADLAQLAQLARGFASRERFLTELTLDPPEATSAEAGPPLRDEDYLILSTIHSAKGQEWTAVFLLNAVDGCIPSDMATGRAAEIEEERRLLYVAMTRARQHLHLLVPLRFHVTQQAAWGDRHLYASLTRFIPAPLAAAQFETVGPPAAAAGAPPDQGVTTDTPPWTDVGARLRGRWG